MAFTHDCIIIITTKLFLRENEGLVLTTKYARMNTLYSLSIDICKIALCCMNQVLTVDKTL